MYKRNNFLNRNSQSNEPELNIYIFFFIILSTFNHLFLLIENKIYYFSFFILAQA